jgi:hypothetical protein
MVAGVPSNGSLRTKRKKKPPPNHTRTLLELIACDTAACETYRQQLRQMVAACLGATSCIDDVIRKIQKSLP